MTNTDIPLDLANSEWKHDAQSEQCFLLPKRIKLLYGCGYFLLGATFVLRFFRSPFGLSEDSLFAPIIFGFGCLAASELARRRLRHAAPLCSYCRKPMRYIEKPVMPTDENLERYQDVIQGLGDKIYVRPKPGAREAETAYFEIKEGVYICEKCKRYILLEEHILHLIGSMQHVEKREQERAKIREISQRLQNKKIKINKTVDHISGSR